MSVVALVNFEDELTNICQLVCKCLSPHIRPSFAISINRHLISNPAFRALSLFLNNKCRFYIFISKISNQCMHYKTWNNNLISNVKNDTSFENSVPVFVSHTAPLAEWLKNRRGENWVTRSAVRLFARTAHSFACSALLASLVRSFIRSLVHSLPSSWEKSFLSVKWTRQLLTVSIHCTAPNRIWEWFVERRWRLKRLSFPIQHSRTDQISGWVPRRSTTYRVAFKHWTMANKNSL